jgi:hypothetical protein
VFYADFEILNVETGREDDENSSEIERGKLKQGLNIASGKYPIKSERIPTVCVIRRNLLVHITQIYHDARSTECQRFRQYFDREWVVRGYPRCLISSMTCTKTLPYSTVTCEQGYNVMTIIIVKLKAKHSTSIVSAAVFMKQ